MPGLTFKPTVRAVHCEHTATDETVYQALARVTAPLEAAWARLGRASTIAIKFNQDKAPKNGDHPDHAMWYKFVDMDEAEGEHYEVYERALAHLAESPSAHID